MALFYNSTTDAKSSIPHSTSVNPHSCVGRTKEPAYLKRFKDSTNNVLQSRNMPGQDQDSKSLLNSVAASVAVRRNAMELKFLESALTALRLKEKKALRNLENEMRKYRMDLDRIQVRSVTSKIAQNIDRLVPPVVSDEVLLRRVGKNRKLRVSIQQPGEGLKDSALRGPKFPLKPTTESKETVGKQSIKRGDLQNGKTAGKEPAESAREPENVEAKNEENDNTEKDKDIILKDKEPKPDMTSTDAVVTASKPAPRVTSSLHRNMQGTDDVTLTDSIARTCGEYFSLLKIINDHHQTGTSSATARPPMGVVEHERSLAVIQPSRSQTPRTVRLREAGTQIEKRYVTPRNDVTVEREMWPSWWTPNSKPVQTENIDRPRPITQSYPPVRQRRTAYAENDDAVSDHYEQCATPRQHIQSKKVVRKVSRTKTKQNHSPDKSSCCPCAKPKPKTKPRLVRPPSSSESETSDSVQYQAPDRHQKRNGVFLTQSSDEFSSTSGVAQEPTRLKHRDRRADVRSVTRRIESRRAKPRRTDIPASPVHRSTGHMYPQCSHMHECLAQRNNCAAPSQSSFHNVNIKAQFQCNANPCHGLARPGPMTPLTMNRANEHRPQNVFRQATPLATPVESNPIRTRNSTSGFSSCEMDDARLSTNLPSPLDDSPVPGGLPERMKLKHESSICNKSPVIVVQSESPAVIPLVKDDRSHSTAQIQVATVREASKEDNQNIYSNNNPQENEPENCPKEAERKLTPPTAISVETRDCRTQTSRHASPILEENQTQTCSIERTESHNTNTTSFIKPKSARVVPALHSNLDNPVFRIELCAISEDQEIIAESPQAGANAKGQAGVFRFRNPTRNGRAPKKYQLILNDSDESRAHQPTPQVTQPIPPPPITKQNVQRWQSDMVADNVFSREPLPSSAWCHSTQQRKFIPAQCIEPALPAGHTPNVQRFETPGTGKSTAPPNTALVRGEECSDFLQSNSCLSGDFATRWRHGVKSRARSGFTSTGRRSILKPVFEKTYMGCGSGEDHEHFCADENPNACEDQHFDYNATNTRPMTTANTRRRPPTYTTEESRYEEPLYDFTNGSPLQYQNREEMTPNNSFLFEATRLPELYSEQGCTFHRDPTFARTNYQISRSSKPEVSNPLQPKLKPTTPQSEVSHETAKNDEGVAKQQTLKEKVWQIKSPRREPVWKRKRVDSSSSFRQLYDMQEYSLTADQCDPGLGLTSSSSGVIPRFRRASATSSGELRLQQALALERSNQQELKAKIDNFRDRMASSKTSNALSQDHGMREIVTRGNSVGRKRRKK